MASSLYLCNEFGQWVGGNLECSLPGGARVSCVADQARSEQTCLGSRSDFVQGCNVSQPGVVCLAVCRPGFQTPDASGREEWECDADGKWTANKALCRGVVCSGPPEAEADSCEGQFGGALSNCSGRCTHAYEWFDSESWLPTVSLTVGDAQAAVYECGWQPNSTLGVWKPLGRRLLCQGPHHDRSKLIALCALVFLVLVTGGLCVAKRYRRAQRRQQTKWNTEEDSLTEQLLQPTADPADSPGAWAGGEPDSSTGEQAEVFSGFDTSREADLADIELFGFLAKGASGSVYSARWNGMKCAVKRFASCADGPEQEELLASFHKEVFLLRNLHHENLVRFYSACTQPGSLAIITELMPASLSDLLYGKHKAQLPADKWHDRRKFQLLSDIISGVAFLHGKNVSHRDLKSMNVLCDKDFRAKLCDFGASSFRARASVRFETRVGTPAWMAPEVLSGQQYTMAADIWSVGVIVWEMLNRVEPWAGANPFAIAVQVGANGRRLDIDALAGTWWHSLLVSCWAEEEERPSVGDLQHALVNLRKDLLLGKAISDGAGLPWTFKRGPSTGQLYPI